MRGFTLVELLVVVLIVGLVSVVTLPAVIPAIRHREVSEAARILQGALVGARDKAIHDDRPSGIRLVPDPAWPYAPGQALAYGRIVPIGPAPEYSEGAVTVRPGVVYAADVMAVPGLLLEEAPSDARGAPNPPASWMWNVRVGDKVQVGDAGPWYTIVGPMAVGPAKGNPEMYVNVGPPGTVSPLDPTGNHPVDYLILTNGVDDDANGWPDEGRDGVDNNSNGLVDEHQPGVFDAVTVIYPPGAPPRQVRVERDEWEPESWRGAVASGVASRPYTIRRRPMPLPGAREVALPTSMVVDAARSRLPVDPLAGTVEILINPDGTAAPSLPYGVPSSLNLASAFLHFALVERGDVGTPGPDPPPAPKGSWSMLTLQRGGRIVVADNPPPDDPFAYGQQGGR